MSLLPMKYLLPLAAVLLTHGTLHASPPREPLTVTFFGNNHFLPQNVEWLKAQPNVSVTIINLDEPRNLEKELSAGLPVDEPERALALTRQRLQSINPSRWETLFRGHMKARQWGVKRYPAVVFGDGKGVVYGLTDLQDAFGYWQEAHP